MTTSFNVENMVQVTVTLQISNFTTYYFLSNEIILYVFFLQTRMSKLSRCIKM